MNHGIGKSEFFRIALITLVSVVPFASAIAGVDVSKLPPPASKKVVFSEDIQPIFEASCVKCHGVERPKGRFSLVSRAAALRGGDNGVDIIPKDSANSPLIHYVSRLDPDMEMPPRGKGDPLTEEQIGLLRAWIDQGATWAEEEAPQPAFSISPSMRVYAVSGDKYKFREHFWHRNGENPAVEEFSFSQKISDDETVSVRGHAFPIDQDFAAEVRYERNDIGFLTGGFERYRKYYDNSGGFYPFPQSIFSLDRDLHLTFNRAWFQIGTLQPDLPRISLGYEYQYKEGAKSTLQWGTVRTTSAPLLPVVSVEKNIYPAFKDIDEQLHIIKVDASHDLAGVGIEDNFRAEFLDLGTHRVNALSLTQGQLTPNQSIAIDEAQQQFNGANAIRLQKEIRDWWFLTGGYLYSFTDANAGLQQSTFHSTGIPIAGDYWRSHALVVKQNSHVFSANMRLGPWEDFAVTAGVQSEWNRQEGIGSVSFDTGNPATFLLIQPARIDANYDRQTLQENVRLQYTGLPYTSLFAEGKLEQEDVGQFEDQIGGPNEFVRDTDVESDERDLRAGFYSSPLTFLSLGGHYRNRVQDNDYNHRVDLASGLPNDGYPAFIRERRTDTDEVEARLTLRPIQWVKTTLTYQLVDTDYDSATDPISGITPGGGLRAATFDANVYGANIVLTPWQRWYFSGTFNYYESQIVSKHNNVPSVVPYEGDVFTVMANVTYALTKTTDLGASFTMSKADYAQNNYAAGLPVGISYNWRGIEFGITKRFEDFTTRFQYGYFDYSEPSSGGYNDYSAHMILATLNLRWR